MSIDLEVISMGARTPLGLCSKTSASAVRAGISRFKECSFVTADGQPMTVAADPLLPSLIHSRERMLTLAHSAIAECIGDIERRVQVPHHVLLSVPEPRPGFSMVDATWLATALSTALRSQHSALTLSLVGRGHAGSIEALQRIAERTHDAEAVYLIVGVDSYNDPYTFTWLERERLFASPNIRAGFIPGEGAGCIAVASTRLRRHLGLPSLATITGVATDRERALPDHEAGSTGVGMSNAIAGATASFGRHASVDAVYVDLNGERYRSEEWGFVVMRVPHPLGSRDYVAPSACWGDIGAAFGPLASILIISSYERGYCPGPESLVATGSFGGLRGAMIMRRPERSSEAM